MLRIPLTLDIRNQIRNALAAGRYRPHRPRIKKNNFIEFTPDLGGTLHPLLVQLHAKNACQTAGHLVSDHFPDVSNTISVKFPICFSQNHSIDMVH
jgi:hypothetical protein